MKIFKKEKKVVALVKQHLEAVELCVETVADTLEHYVLGDLTKAEERAQQADDAESMADDFRSEIRDTLFSGAYLPLIREDIHHLVESVDWVANGAENCSDFFLGQQPEIPEELREAFIDIVRASFGIVKPLTKALSIYFKPKGKVKDVRAHTKEVGEQESIVDAKEWELTRAIFGSSLDLAHKLHLKLALDQIVDVPDRAEDAAERLELTGLKSVI